MVKIIARISSRPGMEARLRQVLRDLVIPTRCEAGCVSYHLYEDDEDPREFVTIEHWHDPLAADAHVTSPHVAAAIAQARDLLAQPPVIHRFSEVI